MRCFKNVDRGTKRQNGTPEIDFCRKKSRHFYRVTYSSGVNTSPWLMSRKVYGFCSDCNKGMSEPHNWDPGKNHGEGSVWRLWIVPASVTTIQETEAKLYLEDVMVERIKTKFKDIMKSKWTSKVSREVWFAAFQEATDELVIENVMES